MTTEKMTDELLLQILEEIRGLRSDLAEPFRDGPIIHRLSAILSELESIRTGKSLEELDTECGPRIF